MATKKKRKPSAYNRHVGREMRRGLTMAQAAASWKKKGSKPKPTRRRVVKRAPKRKSRKLARKKRTYRRKNGFSQAKMFSLIRKLSLIAPGLGVAIGGGDARDKVARGILAYTGYNTAVQRYELEPLKNTYTPFIATTVITAVIPRLAGFVKGVI
jgi:hypothetical protein|tara:strand:+ start:2360 stop:2824 length:465 start_codon:yes stop_codon:yes gene_type:complete